MEKVQVNGTTIAYEIVGQGEPLMLIHGAGVSHVIFKPLHDELGKKFQLILPDVRGHGESEQSSTPYSIKLFADDLVSLLDILNIQRVCILGHSMGGTIAQQMAVDHPDRVRALLLADTSFGSSKSRMIRLLLNISASIARLRGMKKSTEDAIGRQAKSAEAKELLHKAYAPQVANPANFDNIYRAIMNFDGNDMLQSIQCPSLVMISDENRVSRDYIHRMAKLIPNAQVVTVANIGYQLNWENPEAFNAAVIEFLEKVINGY